MRRGSKTEERSDEGIYERNPIAFHRKLTSLEKGDSKSRYEIPRLRLALPMVGFDCENSPPDCFGELASLL